MIDDTALHIKACELADSEAFRLYGTDSIHDKHVLWPRWLALYNRYLSELYA